MAEQNNAVAAKVPESGTVTVACKMPNGIFMTVYGQEDYDVPVVGGGTRTEKRSFALNAPIKINGPAAPQGQSSKHPISGGYALTHNVPAQVAKKWMQDNRDSALIQNNIIFVSGGAERATSQAKEMKEIRSGFERLDPSKKPENGRQVPRDERWPRSGNPNLSNVDTAELAD
jgi:hypothetical protein